MTERIRGVIAARLILSVARGVDRFNALAREARISSPQSASRILKKLQRAGYVAHEVEGQLRTRWFLTEDGKRQIEPSKAVLMSAIALHDEREFARKMPKILPPSVEELDAIDRRLVAEKVFDRLDTGRCDPAI
jgi:DNA-binding HxlR family transcriptional regulator